MRPGLKIVHSLWTKPLTFGSQPSGSSGVTPHHTPGGGGWPSWKQYWLSWVLSAWQAHETHGAVELVTDSVGARILVRELGLPYRRVSCALDRCNAHPGLWAYGKVLAYREHVELGQPFLHIDSDVYLWKPMPERVTNAGVVAQHYEFLPEYPPYEDIYNRPRKTFEAVMKRLPPSWASHAHEHHAINMGAFGGTDLGTLGEYCRQVTDLVEHPDNAPGWKAIIDSGVANVGWSNMLVEQFTAYCVARQRGAAMTMLFEKDRMRDLNAAGRELGYTHVMGSKRLPAGDDFMLRLERRVEEHWPKAWERIELGIRGFELTGGPASAPSALRQAASVARRALHAGASVAKTTVGVERATDAQVKARLDVCRKCPGGHAMWKNGDLHTCGPMLASMKGNGNGTCGCVLRKKARDLTEACPFGWWPALRL